MSSQPVSIAYILANYPDVTQTFIYREVLALRRRGLVVHTLSILRPPAKLAAEAIPLVDETFYIFPIPWFKLLGLHLRYLFNRPLLYLGTLIFVLTRPGEPLKSRWRTLIHFLYSLLAVREVERLQPDYIHTHFGWSASTVALIASRLLKIPFSITLHSFYNKEAHPRHLLIEDKIRAARFVVTISEYHRQILVDLMAENGVAGKIHVVHHGLNPDAFTRPVETNYNNDMFTVVAVGQLIACKGFQVLIEACHLLAERGIAFHCHILGEGEERSRLEKLVDQYNLREHVLLPGRVYQEDLRQLLSQADAFALPCVRDESGRQDGLPVVLTEAMAMELPVISTRIAGIPELVDHGHNGFLTSPGDAKTLADMLLYLNDNPAVRQQFGKAGREKVLAEFSIHRSIDKLANLLTSATTEGELISSKV